MTERSRSRSGNSKNERYAKPSKGVVKKKRDPVDTSKYDDLPPWEDQPLKKSKIGKERAKNADVATKIKKRLEAISEDDEEEEDESIFKQDFDKLRASLSPDNGDNLRIDQVSASFFRASLAMIMELMPIAEKAYRKTQKESAAYALTALMNQARDLTNDVRRSEDAEGQALQLKSVVDTTFKSVAQLLLQEKFALQTKVDAITNDPRVRKAIRAEMDATILSFTIGLREHSNLLSARIRSFLLGEANYMKPGEEVIEKKFKKKKVRTKEAE
jgi:hypothetical protein